MKDKKLQLTIKFFIEQKREEIWTALQITFIISVVVIMAVSLLTAVCGILYLMGTYPKWTFTAIGVICALWLLFEVCKAFYKWIRSNWRKAKERADKEIADDN